MGKDTFKTAKYRIQVDESLCALCQSCALFCSMDKWGEVSPEMGCMKIDIDPKGQQVYILLNKQADSAYNYKTEPLTGYPLRGHPWGNISWKPVPGQWRKYSCVWTG